MATDINADVFAEIESGIERIKVLVAEGNSEAAEELKTEVETMISGLKKGQQIVAKRKAFRDALTAAMKPADTPSGALEVRASAEPAHVLVGENVPELVKQGAERVREVTIGKIKGGRAIAEIIFQIRRNIFLPDGTPDWNARSQEAKDRASEVYDAVTASLPAEGESDEADAIREEIGSIKRSAQTAMGDVKVDFARALDNSEPAELEPYASILKDGMKPSEAIAAHYDFPLKYRREIEAERRAAKAELPAGTASEVLHKSLVKGKKDRKDIDRAELRALDTEAKRKLREEIEAEVARLSILLTDLTE
jgi:hypothetical protein